MEVTYQCTVRDYVEAQSAVIKGSAGYRVLIVVAIFFLFLAAYELYYKTVFDAVPALLMSTAWLGWAFAGVRWWAKRDFAKHPNLRKEYTLSADEGGLRLKTDISDGSGSWAVYTKSRETPSLFLLFCGARIFSMIPKRAFSPSQLEIFRDLVRRSVPSK
jgi:YcxB-like protein